MTPRCYIRHPSEIPILIQVAGHEEGLKLRDISLGGLCVQTPSCLADHTKVLIRIPLLWPEFEARGRVVWCHYVGTEQALLGVCFSDPETAYSVRMIEQICANIRCSRLIINPVASAFATVSRYSRARRTVS